MREQIHLQPSVPHPNQEQGPARRNPHGPHRCSGSIIEAGCSRRWRQVAAGLSAAKSVKSVGVIKKQWDEGKRERSLGKLKTPHRDQMCSQRRTSFLSASTMAVGLERGRPAQPYITTEQLSLIEGRAGGDEQERIVRQRGVRRENGALGWTVG